MKELGIEGEALARGAVRRVGLDEFVVEERSWGRRIVEQLVGIVYVWDLQQVCDQVFGEICAISKRVGVYLFQLVHATEQQYQSI